MTLATLDQWNDEYRVKTRPDGSASEVAWTNDGTLKMQLFNDVGEVSYSDVAFAIKDYSSTGATVTNGKKVDNNLTWNDSTGSSKTTGSIQFATYRGVRMFKGTMTRVGTPTSTTVEIMGIPVEEAEGVSIEGRFVIVGSVLGIIMMVSLIPMVKNGVRKGYLGAKKGAGAATLEDLAELDRLAAESRKNGFSDLSEHVSRRLLKIPTTAAEFATLADELETRAREFTLKEQAALQEVTTIEQRLAATRAEIVKIDVAIADIPKRFPPMDHVAIEQAMRDKRGRVELTEKAEILERARKANEHRDFEAKARAHKRAAEVALRHVR